MSDNGKSKRQNPIRVLLVDDFPVILEGLVALLGRFRQFSIAGTAGDGREAVRLYGCRRPDVVLLDLRMPKMDGLQAAETILKSDPQARIIMLSAYAGEEDIYRALKAGVRGYILKDSSPAEIVHAVRQVYAGQTVIPPEVAAKLAVRVGSSGLTLREIEILQLVAAGKSNKQIGADLDRTEGTVKIHVSNILRKMRAADRTQAATLAIRQGLVRLREEVGRKT